MTSPPRQAELSDKKDTCGHLPGCVSGCFAKFLSTHPSPPARCRRGIFALPKKSIPQMRRLHGNHAHLGFEAIPNSQFRQMCLSRRGDAREHVLAISVLPGARDVGSPEWLPHSARRFEENTRYGYAPRRLRAAWPTLWHLYKL